MIFFKICFNENVEFFFKLCAVNDGCARGIESKTVREFQEKQGRTNPANIVILSADGVQSHAILLVVNRAI